MKRKKVSRSVLLDLLQALMENNNEMCEYDHHGYCQSHYLDERPCLYEVIRQILLDEHK